MNNKVYSLDTYRELKKDSTKLQAIQGSTISDQKGLDQHFKNIEVINNKPFVNVKKEDVS